MSHFLKKDETRGSRALSRPYAAAKVKYEDGVLKTQNCVIVARPDALFVPLPTSIKVVDAKGKAVRPAKGRRFFVTTETLNPYHAVVDAVSIPLPPISSTK